ncbi:pentapeptide repeat-containing protein [Nostoc sp. XA010]|uniref:pentapeptide repeat-containing protein n=1 Tax=Nostoc sp. XA010 TaxID=2780407 RepID=UPI001E54A3F5|nr:pentapeptide repeat-containing protein [Nostoc sp. XA010]MCC5657427.1 pentapeptide repeat-containing protein [Nostoc sp. XA010]
MEKITAEDLLRRYAAGERNFQQIILEYADLSGVELENISLKGARFSYVNLSSIKLWDCDLTAKFTYCNLTDAVKRGRGVESGEQGGGLEGACTPTNRERPGRAGLNTHVPLRFTASLRDAARTG